MDKDMEQPEPSHMVGGILTWDNPFTKELTSIKVEDVWTLHPSVPLLGIYPKKLLHMCPRIHVQEWSQ